MSKPSFRARTTIVAVIALVSLLGCGQVKHEGPDSKSPSEIETQIRGGLSPSTSVNYVCEGHENERVAAAFYNQTDPKSAVIAFDGRQVIVLAAPSASGARYTGPDVEFWEHQGEATITAFGSKRTCKPS